MLNNFNKRFVIFLMGPTASGKSQLAMQLRQYLPVELISVDSALIYKNMNIGTSKPSDIELLKHPHRLINLIDPKDSYSVSDFRRDAIKSIEEIFSIRRIPLLVGGTMLYYHILLHGMSVLPKANLELRNRLLHYQNTSGKNFLHKYLSIVDYESSIVIHPNDIHRIIRALEVYLLTGNKISVLKRKKTNFFPYNLIQFAIVPEKRYLHNNIKNRFYHMLHQGLEYEVRKLFYRGDLSIKSMSMRCIGYRHMWLYLLNQISYTHMIRDAILATQHFSKKQITWLKTWKNLYTFSDKNITVLIKKILHIIYLEYSKY